MPMTLFTLKLILTPTLIALVSLAGRRWGAFISGWLVGLPLTSGPIVFFLAVDHNPEFSAAAALGILSGTLSQALFCLAYSRLCTRFGWPQTLAMSLAAFATGTLFFNYFRPPASWLFLLTVLGLSVIYRCLPATVNSVIRTRPLPIWDIPLRMLIATSFVIGVTEASEHLGPHLTGLLSPFPLYATILAIFSQHFAGPPAAIRVLRGMVQGLFSFALFFLLVAGFIEKSGIGATLLLSITVALGLQGALAWWRVKSASRQTR